MGPQASPRCCPCASSRQLPTLHMMDPVSISRRPLLSLLPCHTPLRVRVLAQSGSLAVPCCHPLPPQHPTSSSSFPSSDTITRPYLCLVWISRHPCRRRPLLSLSLSFFLSLLFSLPLSDTAIRPCPCLVSTSCHSRLSTRALRHAHAGGRERILSVFARFKRAVSTVIAAKHMVSFALRHPSHGPHPPTNSRLRLRHKHIPTHTHSHTGAIDCKLSGNSVLIVLTHTHTHTHDPMISNGSSPAPTSRAMATIRRKPRTFSHDRDA